MTFVEKHRFTGDRSEAALLRMSCEGELFGVGLFEALAESYPEDVAQLEELGGTPETHEVAPLTAEPT